MKKLFGIFFGVLLIFGLVLVPVGTARADDPTIVNVNWGGTGVVVTGTVTAGNDAIHSFTVNALSSSGQFNVTDYNNNPYTYNVDSTVSNIQALVSGGTATYTTLRTDSYVPMYGAAGQNTFSGIMASPDGTAGMAMWTNTNYASAQEANYGRPSLGGNQFTANASSFQIIHQVWDSAGDTAYLTNFGSGVSSISCMSSDLGAGSLTFGKGAGCYTKADFNGNGAQTLEFGSAGHSSVSQFGFNVPGNGSANSATLTTTITFIGAFSTPNPSTGPGFSANVD